MSQAGGMRGSMVIRDEVREAIEQVAAAAEECKRAYEVWQRALEERDRRSEQMERRITKATGGLSVARFEVACRRRRVYTVQDAKAKARALRARPAVETAVAERGRVIADADAKVLAARIDLAYATKAVARYEAAGLAMTGLSASDLRRFSRLPPIT